MAWSVWLRFGRRLIIMQSNRHIFINVRITALKRNSYLFIHFSTSRRALSCHPRIKLNDKKDNFFQDSTLFNAQNIVSVIRILAFKGFHRYLVNIFSNPHFHFCLFL